MGYNKEYAFSLSSNGVIYDFKVLRFEEDLVHFASRYDSFTPIECIVILYEGSWEISSVAPKIDQSLRLDILEFFEKNDSPWDLEEDQIEYCCDCNFV